MAVDEALVKRIGRANYKRHRIDPIALARIRLTRIIDEKTCLPHAIRFTPAYIITRPARLSRR